MTLKQISNQTYDILGLGFGPFNMSLAALTEKLEHSCLYLDRKPSFGSWHDGLLFSNAVMQTSIFKDLVTPVDPKNHYSFLNFLVSTGKFYSYFNAEFESAPRYEFSNYLKWAASNLDKNVKYNSEIESVKVDELGFFQVNSNNGIFKAKNLVLGTGRAQPEVSETFKTLPSHAPVYNGHTILKSNIQTNIEKIVIIGGGQTGAEILLHCLKSFSYLKDIIWLTNKNHFMALDESPFANELFTPSYIDYFYELHPKSREALILEQYQIAQGISPQTCVEIYQNIYHSRNKGCNFNVRLGTSISAEDITLDTDQRCDILCNLKLLKTKYKQFKIKCDAVILATGLKKCLPPFMEEILKHKNQLQDLRITKDYALQLEMPTKGKLYIQNQCIKSHGIQDVNLSLAAHRAATIANSIFKKQIYRLDYEPCFVDWEGRSLHGNLL